jgi:surfeit locus 1 family protein
MRIANYEFKPRLLPTLATLILLPVLISLGIWQLGRADEKRMLLQAQAQKALLPVYDISDEHAKPADLDHRRLKATGRFDAQHRIYIDNKVYQGKVGYDVVDPLMLDNSDTVVLVNRGWVAATESRAVLPPVPLTDTHLLIEGLAKFQTKDVASLGAGNRVGEGWPALVRWIDISELQKSLPYKLKPYLLLQTNDTQDGLMRDWKFASSPPEKNISYAIQWFSLAIALVLIYLFVNTKKIKL